MKIFVDVDLPELKIKIAKRFGHANYYLTYDTDSKNCKIIGNKSMMKNIKFFLKY